LGRTDYPALLILLKLFDPGSGWLGRSHAQSAGAGRRFCNVLTTWSSKAGLLHSVAWKIQLTERERGI
jgi:hypothetical protein